MKEVGFYLRDRFPYTVPLYNAVYKATGNEEIITGMCYQN